MKFEIIGAWVDFYRRRFSKPLILSGDRILSALTEARAYVVVRHGEVQKRGMAQILLSYPWAWPGPGFDDAEKDGRMRLYCHTVAANLRYICNDHSDHPFSMGMALYERSLDRDDRSLPPLAVMVCKSPFDSAIHDAVAKIRGTSAPQLYRDPRLMTTTAYDHLFAGGSALAAIRNMILPDPPLSIPGMLVVGKDDTVEEIGTALRKTGYHSLKLKTLGQDQFRDAERVVQVYDAALATGLRLPRLVLDSNCASPDSIYIDLMLGTISTLRPYAYASILFLEQMTDRDIEQNPFDWHSVAKHKPVFADEGLISVRSIDIARKQGWSGLAFKQCRGISPSLLFAAYGRELGMTSEFLSLTDTDAAPLVWALALGGRVIEHNAGQFMRGDVLKRWCRADMDETFYPVNGLLSIPRQPIGIGSSPAQFASTHRR